jgi:hypothetical protein
MKLITRNIGDEYDDKLLDALRNVLIRNSAAMVNQSWGIGGSQQLESTQVILEGQELLIESETFIGLTISGPEEIVNQIADQVTTELNSL